MDPSGIGKDAVDERVGIGRFELCQLPPVEHPRRDLHAIRGKLLENVGGCRIGARLGLLAAGESHPVEQDLPKLFWRPDIELLAGKIEDLAIERLHAGREIIRHPGQDRRIDGDTGIFHRRQHRNQRPFKPLIDRCNAFDGEPGSQHLPQAQRDIGILGGVIQRRLGCQRPERHLLGALAADILIFDGRVIEPVPSK